MRCSVCKLEACECTLRMMSWEIDAALAADLPDSLSCDESSVISIRPPPVADLDESCSSA